MIIQPSNNYFKKWEIHQHANGISSSRHPCFTFPISRLISWPGDMVPVVHTTRSTWRHYHLVKLKTVDCHERRSTNLYRRRSWSARSGRLQTQGIWWSFRTMGSQDLASRNICCLILNHRGTLKICFSSGRPFKILRLEATFSSCSTVHWWSVLPVQISKVSKAWIWKGKAN